APVRPPAAPPAAPAASAPVPSGGGQVTSPLPGVILEVRVSVGDVVRAGDVVAILEAMKMENEITAPTAGRVAAVEVAPGTAVGQGQVIAVIEPA
ncbi:MAG: acetyl-CoA carboxylase biotin carboxyl carrier protein subunit, partial [Bacillota bacterium]